MYSNKGTDLIYRISMRSESWPLQHNSGTAQFNSFWLQTFSDG